MAGKPERPRTSKSTGKQLAAKHQEPASGSQSNSRVSVCAGIQSKRAAQGSSSQSKRSVQATESQFKQRVSCLVCKFRRVKCDGARPSCGQCKQVKRVCHGYADDPRQPDSSDVSSLKSSSAKGKSAVRIAGTEATTVVLRTPPGTPSPSDREFLEPISERPAIIQSPVLTTPEDCLVHMYRTRTTPQVLSFENAASVSRWKDLIVQALEQDQTLRYNASSFAAHHDHFVSQSASSGVLANKYYGKTLNGLVSSFNGRHLDAHDLTLLVLNAGLLVCVEFFRGNFDAMRVHALSIIKVLGDIPTNELTSNLDLAERYFRRGYVYLSRFPALYPAFTSLERRHIANRSWFPETHATYFAEFNDADRGFHDLLLPIMFYEQALERTPQIRNDPATLRDRDEILEAFNSYSISLETFLANHLTELETSKQVLADRYRIYVLMYQIMLSTSLPPIFPPSPTPSETSPGSPPPGNIQTYQTSFDAYTSTFKKMMALLVITKRHKSPVFKINLNTVLTSVPTLFFVMVHCRDPRIRRHAIALMNEDTTTHAQWYPPAMVRVGMRLIELEEGRLDSNTVPAKKLPVNSAEEIPETCRVSGVRLHLDLPNGVMKMGYRCWEEGSLVEKVEDITWG